MPDRLGFIAAWTVAANPRAVRSAGPQRGFWLEQHSSPTAVVGPLLSTAVYLPLADRRFQRLSR